ncbi:MAG: hypothetical protein IKJ24_07440 [Clostridia bacterium]|nr:hypothetical protein [Clostridia bacterium]
MKKTDVLVNSLIYSFSMLISCVVVMLAEALLTRVLGSMFVLDPLTLCIIRAVVYSIGVPALLAIMAYKEGYRTGYCSVAGTAVSGLIASLAHFLFSLLFSFEAFASGGVKFVAALVKFGDKLNLKSFSGKLSLFDSIPFFFLFALVYIAAMIICGKLGERARIRSRKELTGSQTNVA